MTDSLPSSEHATAGRRLRRLGWSVVALFLLVQAGVLLQAQRLDQVRHAYEQATVTVTDLANVQRQAERLRSSVLEGRPDLVERDLALLERQLLITTDESRTIQDLTVQVDELLLAFDQFTAALEEVGASAVAGDGAERDQLIEQASTLSLAAKIAYDREEQRFFGLTVAGIDESSRLGLGLLLVGATTMVAGGLFFLRLRRRARHELEAANEQLREEVREREASEARLAQALAEVRTSEAMATRAANELALHHQIVLAGIGGGLHEVTGRVADELVRTHGFPMIAIVLLDDDQVARAVAIAGLDDVDTKAFIGHPAIVTPGGPLEQVLAGGPAVEVDLVGGVVTALPRAQAMQVAPIHLGDRRVGALITEVEGQDHVLSLPALQRLADQVGVLAEAARGYDDQVRLAAKFRELDELKTEFVATVSHELRTPLTAIVGMAMTLDEYWERVDESERRDMVARMRRQGRRQQRLVDDLLTISRMQQGRVVVRRETVRIRPLVDDVARDLEVEVGNDVPDHLHVLADRDHVVRILNNFITNAVKYAEGSPIRVLAEEHATGVDLVVADEGPGVPEAFRERLFDAFTQASSGTTRTSQGIGLGLSIVRTLAAANDGSAWYRPGEERGSRFGVTFAAPGRPRERADLARAS